MNNKTHSTNNKPEINTHDHSREETTVMAVQVPDNQRIKITADHFGMHFPMKLEPAIFYFAELMAENYNGGCWRFYTLSNGGFYMAPEQDEPFEVSAMNGYEGELSADALGIAACLYAYSNCSFGEGRLAEICAEHYHLLLDFACEHQASGSILRAID